MIGNKTAAHIKLFSTLLHPLFCLLQTRLHLIHAVAHIKINSRPNPVKNISSRLNVRLPHLIPVNVDLLKQLYIKSLFVEKSNQEKCQRIVQTIINFRLVQLPRRRMFPVTYLLPILFTGYVLDRVSRPDLGALLLPSFVGLCPSYSYNRGFFHIANHSRK